MSLPQGKIGVQEDISLHTIVMLTAILFTANTEKIFSNGNSSYMTQPFSVLLSFLGVLPLMWGIRVSKSRDLSGFLRFLYGKSAAALLGFFLSALFLFSAFSLLTKFSDILHSFSYVHSEHVYIVFWLLFSVLLLSTGGIERLGRSAKCLSMLLLFMLLLVLLLPAENYSLHRLYPLPGKTGKEILLESVCCCVYSLPAFLCALVHLPGLHGIQSAGRSLLYTCFLCVILSFLTQFCMGLSFHHTELENLYIPLFRLDTILLKDSYFMRLDKLLLFVTLPAALLGAAYYLYTGVFLTASHLHADQLKPGICGAGTLLLIWIVLAFSKFESPFRQILSFMETWGSFLLFPFCFISGFVGILKSKKAMEEKC